MSFTAFLDEIRLSKNRSHRNDLNIGDSACFVYEVIIAQPDLPALVQGFIPQNKY